MNSRRVPAKMLTRSSGAFLLVLLAHLLFMVSPLHAQVEHGAVAPSLEGMHAFESPTTPDAAQVAERERGEHCAIDWAALPERLSAQLSADAAPGSVPVRPLAAADRLGGAWHPPEPLQILDAQSLLQVFRL